MNVEVGQDISSILGTSGSYIGNSNSVAAQSLMSGLGNGFTTENSPTTAGFFNRSAAGVETKAAPAPLAAPVPTVAAKFEV